jgi:hypothetical protein
MKPRHGFARSFTAVPPAPTFALGDRSRGLPAACAVSFAHGYVGYLKPSLLAALDCTLPGRGKSQAIQHNSALPKVGQSLRSSCAWWPTVARPRGFG